MSKLVFSFRNSKLTKLAVHLNLHKNQVVSFDLPAGYTCPAANICKSFANPVTGKIVDSRGMQFRCYAASGEVRFPAVRLAHWNNYNALRKASNKARLIEESLPKSAKIVRIHSSGDFYSLDYFKAWVKVAQRHPEIVFFGYTKILPYVSYPKSDNFHLVYSFGGLMDSKVTSEPVSRVVYTIDEAHELGLPVSCQANPVDDYFYVIGQQSFALVVHGTQPKRVKKTK